MAVSNPPSLSSVVAEFGGPGNLRAYYRGGPYVPNTAANAAISTDPNSLKLSQFAGAVAYTAVSLVLSTYSISQRGFGSNPSGPSGNTPSITATASGGNAAISYTWTRISGDAGTAISSSTAASVTFSRIGCTDGLTYNSVWRCTASDGTSSSYRDESVALGYDRIL